MSNIYDCIIIGAGPAGLAAALYSARDRYSTLVLEKFYPGGQINTTDRIENYPGIVKISGPDLIAQQLKQVEQFGATIKTGAEVKDITALPDGNIKIAAGKNEYIGRCVILAVGSDYRRLGVPGEDEFRNAGAGVSYCGTCDAPFFRDKKVVAVGGGNTAVEDTLHLAKFAREVILVHRRNEFRATKVLVEELMTYVNKPDSNLNLRLDSVVAAIEGAGKVQRAIIQNVKTNEKETIDCDGVFIFVGMVPNTAFLSGRIELTEAGFIRCDTGWLRTAIPGVFAAGDCRVGAAMQLATAIGDGVNAAIMMKQYLRDRNWWKQPIPGAI